MAAVPVIEEGVERGCLCCRKLRTAFVHVQTLECCGHEVNICVERCAKMFATELPGLTVEVYVKKYIRIHSCKRRA